MHPQYFCVAVVLLFWVFISTPSQTMNNTIIFEFEEILTMYFPNREQNIYKELKIKVYVVINIRQK